MATAQPQQGNGLAVSGFVVSVVGAILGLLSPILFYLVPLALGIVGLVLSGIGLPRSRRPDRTGERPPLRSSWASWVQSR